MKRTNTSRILFLAIGIPLAVLLAGALVYNLYSARKTERIGQEIRRHYENNLVLVYHQYVYTVEFLGEEAESMDFVKAPDGTFFPYDPDSLQPNEKSGTGLVWSREGLVITSKNVAEPWTAVADVEALTQMTNEMLNGPANIKVGGRTIALGGLLHARAFGGPSSYVNCTGKGSSTEQDSEIGYLQLEYAPGDVCEIVAAPIQGNTRWDEVYMLAFTEDTVIDLNQQYARYRAHVQHAPLNGDPGRMQMDYAFPLLPNADGAPVFDSEGRLVAINTTDPSAQHPNRGTLALRIASGMNLTAEPAPQPATTELMTIEDRAGWEKAVELSADSEEEELYTEAFTLRGGKARLRFKAQSDPDPSMTVLLRAVDTSCPVYYGQEILRVDANGEGEIELTAGIGEYYLEIRKDKRTRFALAVEEMNGDESLAHR